MIGALPLPQVVAVLLVAAVALASLRLLVGAWRSDAASRPRVWRIAALLALQAASAALLWFTLQPPMRPVEAGTMVVLTANADDAPATRDGEFVVALPEARARTGAERVPDLATALRRHPGTRRLRIVGAGLEARDREAVDGRALSFDPTPLPRGLVELWHPHEVQAGAAFVVRGRVEGIEDGVVELRDPADRRSDRVRIGDDGRFALDAVARSEGLARFRLRVLDAEDTEVEVAEVPLDIVPATPRSVLFLAGGPSPELKYLRRWATDAGLSQHARISVGGGIEIGDGPVAFDAAGLGRFDLVVLDERAWADLGAARHAALRDAVRTGLGVLLRVSGPLTGAARTPLRSLGFELQAARLPSEVRLVSGDDAGAPTAAGQADVEAEAAIDADTRDRDAPLPALSRQPLRVVAADGSPLLHDASGEPLALWRAEGRGRIAVWTLADSYQLVLTGQGDRHARLWSDALAVLARPRDEARPRLVGEAVAGERMVLCGVTPGARLSAPDGAGTPLLADPRMAPGDCAGYWPSSPGWHQLQAMAPADDPDADAGEVWRFHVRARDTLPGVRALALREATARLASSGADRASPDTFVPGQRWPWLLAWLAASGLLWWLERSRFGRHAGAAAKAASAARADQV